MSEQHNIDKFQGYPHYPASEDITRAKNNNGKEYIDDDGIVMAGSGVQNDSRDNEPDIVSGNDTDISQEEIQLLESTDQNMDTADSRNLERAQLDNTDLDGEVLNEAAGSLDLTGEDLDIPGSAEDEAVVNMGEEDEENNYYSLGGDEKEISEDEVKS